MYRLFVSESMHGYVDFDFDEDEDEEDDEEDDAVVAPEPDLRGYEHLRLVGPALLEAAAIAKEGGSRATVGRSRAERVALRSQSTDRAASGGFPLSGDALPRSLNFKKKSIRDFGMHVSSKLLILPQHHLGPVSGRCHSTCLSINAAVGDAAIKAFVRFLPLGYDLLVRAAYTAYVQL
jgi:hypothetical protein